MADVDPNSIPFIPSTDVKVVDDGGKQTTALHDWFQSLWGWMKASVVDLTTKVTTLTADLGDVSAAITEEATIRETEDGLLAASILEVDAKADSATANGQVFLAAKAAPGGATAAYGVYLTAGSTFTGLEMIAKSGGGSAIGMTASQLTFTDSGTSQAVFGYSAGVFIFQVPVVIQSATSGARQVLTNENIKIYDSSNVLRVAIGTNI